MGSRIILDSAELRNYSFSSKLTLSSWPYFQLHRENISNQEKNFQKLPPPRQSTHTDLCLPSSLLPKDELSMLPSKAIPPTWVLDRIPSNLLKNSICSSDSPIPPSLFFPLWFTTISVKTWCKFSFLIRPWSQLILLLHFFPCSTLNSLWKGLSSQSLNHSQRPAHNTLINMCSVNVRAAPRSGSWGLRAGWANVWLQWGN